MWRHFDDLQLCFNCANLRVCSFLGLLYRSEPVILIGIKVTREMLQLTILNSFCKGTLPTWLTLPWKARLEPKNWRYRARKGSRKRPADAQQQVWDGNNEGRSCLLGTDQLLKALLAKERCCGTGIYQRFRSGRGSYYQQQSLAFNCQYCLDMFRT